MTIKIEAGKSYYDKAGHQTHIEAALKHDRFTMRATNGFGYMEATGRFWRQEDVEDSAMDLVAPVPVEELEFLDGMRIRYQNDSESVIYTLRVDSKHAVLARNVKKYTPDVSAIPASQTWSGLHAMSNSGFITYANLRALIGENFLDSGSGRIWSYTVSEDCERWNRISDAPPAKETPWLHLNADTTKLILAAENDRATRDALDRLFCMPPRLSPELSYSNKTKLRDALWKARELAFPELNNHDADLEYMYKYFYAKYNGNEAIPHRHFYSSKILRRNQRDQYILRVKDSKATLLCNPFETLSFDNIRAHHTWSGFITTEYADQVSLDELKRLCMGAANIQLPCLWEYESKPGTWETVKFDTKIVENSPPTQNKALYIVSTVDRQTSKVTRSKPMCLRNVRSFLKGYSPALPDEVSLEYISKTMERFGRCSWANDQPDKVPSTIVRRADKLLVISHAPAPTKEEHKTMPTFKLEVGKTYRNNDGKTIDIVKATDVNTFIDSSGWNYYSDGVFCGKGPAEPESLCEEITTPTNQPKESPMSVNLKMKTVTYFNGTDINSLSDETLIENIRAAEKQVESMEAVKNKPKKLETKIKEMQDDINALVKFIDERPAK